MNEFERAIAKTEKREQRKTIHLPSVHVAEPNIQPVIETPVTKEKRPSIDAVIHVTVVLPYDTFDLSFTRPNVLGMRRLSKADFQRAISEGLKTIVGSVK